NNMIKVNGAVSGDPYPYYAYITHLPGLCGKHESHITALIWCELTSAGVLVVVWFGRGDTTRERESERESRERERPERERERPERKREARERERERRERQRRERQRRE